MTPNPFRSVFYWAAILMLVSVAAFLLAAWIVNRATFGSSGPIAGREVARQPQGVQQTARVVPFDNVQMRGNPGSHGKPTGASGLNGSSGRC
ncbi:MAG: hypothetical protein RID23_20810 [Roseovarius sp.]